MRALLAFVACLALTSLAHAEIEFHTLQEDTGTPGSSSGTYAILQDGQMVGLVEHVHSSSGRVFGRRGGPADDAHTHAADHAGHAMELAEAAAEQVGARLAQVFSTQLDFANAVQEQLMAIRCPRARMAALAQLQLASAAAAAAEIDLPQALLWMQPRQGRMPDGGPQPLPVKDQLSTEGEFGDFTLVQHKLFGPQDHAQSAAEAAAAHAAAEEAEAAMEAVYVRRGPVVVLGSEGEQGQGPHHLRGATTTEHFEHHPEHRHRHGHRSEHENFKPQDRQEPWWGSLARPHAVQWWDYLFHPRQPRGQPGDRAGPDGFPLPASGMMAREHRRWLDLQHSAMPVPGQEPDMSWRIRDGEGRVNWGLLAFLGLASACVAVWGALLAQYAVYRSARAHNAAAAYFLARAHSADGLESAGGSGPLKPLLREGPAKEGVEHASSHVPGPQAIVHVLQYQPLSGSEQ